VLVRICVGARSRTHLLGKSGDGFRTGDEARHGACCSRRLQVGFGAWLGLSMLSSMIGITMVVLLSCRSFVCPRLGHAQARSSKVTCK